MTVILAQGVTFPAKILAFYLSFTPAMNAYANSMLSSSGAAPNSDSSAASIEALIPDLASVFVIGLVFGWIASRTENITTPALFHAPHNWSLG